MTAQEAKLDEIIEKVAELEAMQCYKLKHTLEELRMGSLTKTPESVNMAQLKRLSGELCDQLELMAITGQRLQRLVS